MTSTTSDPPALIHIVRAILYLREDATLSNAAILKAFAYVCFGHQAFVAANTVAVHEQVARVMRILRQSACMSGDQNSVAKGAVDQEIWAAIAELEKVDSEKARSLDELMKTELSAGYGRVRLTHA